MHENLIELAKRSPNAETKALAASMAVLYKKTIEMEKKIRGMGNCAQ